MDLISFYLFILIQSFSHGVYLFIFSNKPKEFFNIKTGPGTIYNVWIINSTAAVLLLLFVFDINVMTYIFFHLFIAVIGCILYILLYLLIDYTQTMFTSALNKPFARTSATTTCYFYSTNNI